MKNICLLSLILLFSLSAFAQKPNSLKISKLRHELAISAELGAGFKALAQRSY